MQVAIDQFRVNLARVRNLGVIHNTLNAQTTAAIDLSDILRSELVLCQISFGIITTHIALRWSAGIDRIAVL